MAYLQVYDANLQLYKQLASAPWVGLLPFS